VQWTGAEPVGTLTGWEQQDSAPDFCARRLATDAPKPADRLPAHEHVLGHREVGEQRGLLVDHRDAGGLGLSRGFEIDSAALHPEFARSRAGRDRP
jgi:hypothetical protein